MEPFMVKNLMQTFQIGEDIGLFLVKFERTCEKVEFTRETWPERLQTLLSCEAADVVARLTREESQPYEAVKSSLLKKYRLSAEACRQRVRSTEKRHGVPFREFSYNLKANFVEWLNDVDAYRDHDKVLECLCLEQFFRCLPEETRFWVQDKPDVKTVARDVELAEDFYVPSPPGREMLLREREVFPA